jgi:hypothetical protein
MEEIKAALLSGDGRQIMPPTIIEQVRNLNAQLLSLSTGLSSLQDIIKKISESGFNVIDDAGNVGMKYDENGLDVAAISSHMQGLIKSIEGLGLELGETSSTAYAGDKGKANATAIASLIESLGTLQNNLSSLITSNSGAHTTFSTAISGLQALIRQIAENGFNVIDESGNIGMRYDENGLDVALLSTHFQGLINTLISTVLTAARGATLAPLVNSLIPATYLPSYVDDVIDIDIFGTSAIAQYSSDNDGNTNVLPDKLCYDETKKVNIIIDGVESTLEKGIGIICYSEQNNNRSYAIPSDFMIVDKVTVAHPTLKPYLIYPTATAQAAKTRQMKQSGNIVVTSVANAKAVIAAAVNLNYIYSKPPTVQVSMSAIGSTVMTENYLNAVGATDPLIVVTPYNAAISDRVCRPGLLSNKALPADKQFLLSWTTEINEI